MNSLGAAIETHPTDRPGIEFDTDRQTARSLTSVLQQLAPWHRRCRGGRSVEPWGWHRAVTAGTRTPAAPKQFADPAATVNHKNRINHAAQIRPVHERFCCSGMALSVVQLAVMQTHLPRQGTAALALDGWVSAT